MYPYNFYLSPKKYIEKWYLDFLIQKMGEQTKKKKSKKNWGWQSQRACCGAWRSGSPEKQQVGDTPSGSSGKTCGALAGSGSDWGAAGGRRRAESGRIRNRWTERKRSKRSDSYKRGCIHHQWSFSFRTEMQMLLEEDYQKKKKKSTMHMQKSWESFS